MKTKLFCPILAVCVLLGAFGCSDSTAKATPAEEKAFAGGPPPSNYMDAANKATSAAQADRRKAGGTTP